MGALYPGGRMPKLEPTDPQRGQWMAQPSARPPTLAHRKLKRFIFCYFFFKKIFDLLNSAPSS